MVVIKMATVCVGPSTTMPRYAPTGNLPCARAHLRANEPREGGGEGRVEEDLCLQTQDKRNDQPCLMHKVMRDHAFTHPSVAALWKSDVDADASAGVDVSSRRALSCEGESR